MHNASRGTARGARHGIALVMGTRGEQRSDAMTLQGAPGVLSRRLLHAPRPNPDRTNWVIIQS